MPSMQLLRVGVDAEGRSCVVERTEVVTNPIDGVALASMASLVTTDETPPPPGPPGLGALVNSNLPPGHVSCFVVEHEPRERSDGPTTTDLHWRNALEVVVILDGAAEMVLGDGAHPVVAGDCVVLHGGDHALRPAAVGCRLVAFSIGTLPA